MSELYNTSDIGAANTTLDLVNAINASSGYFLMSSLYLMVCVIIIGGFTLGLRRIDHGFMVGGFFCSIIGIGSVVIGWIAIEMFISMLIIMLVGLTMSIIFTKGE